MLDLKFRGVCGGEIKLKTPGADRSGAVWQKARSAHLHSSACLPLLKIYRSATVVITAYKIPI